MRFKAIRDGIEDFDMFKHAEKYPGREYFVNIISVVISSVIKYSKCGANFLLSA